jgi:CHAD domain-containing protein
MPFHIEKIRRSTRKVEKFLKENLKSHSPRAVHKLRAHARRLEAALTLPGLAGLAGTGATRLIQRLDDLQRRAGKVRDMDVLTADVLTLKDDGEQDCMIRLLEYLGTERHRCEKKLRKSIAAEGASLRHELKKNVKRLEQSAGGRDSVSVEAILSQLKRPARLSRNNLHAYRVRVKTVREILQLFEPLAGKKLLGALGAAKDAIGEWHDWEKLAAIARTSLDHGSACRLVQQLTKTSNALYRRAIQTGERNTLYR